MTMDPATYAALDIYAGTFAATLNGYVLDSREHKDERITPEVLDWAFREGHSISGYTAHVESERVTTTVGAIDFDEGDLNDGARVRDTLWAQEIPSLLVQSRRGCHLWTFHAGDGSHGSEKHMPVAASIVRRALTAAAALVGLSGPKVEVFPKPSASRWGVGALRMPLLPHPKTGLRYGAYDMDGEPLSEVVEVINAVSTMTAPWNKVYLLAGADGLPTEYPRDLGVYGKPRPIRQGDTPKVTDLLASLGVEANVGHTVRCPFHQDGHASLSIAPDDERVFCKSPACPVYNGGRGMGSLALRAYLSKSKGAQNP